MNSGQKAFAELWKMSGKSEFVRVAKEGALTAYQRLLAIESLFNKNEEIGLNRKEIAEIYCKSLAKNFLKLANLWGTPVHPERLGKRLISLGSEALPALQTLLSNKQIVQYIGSRDVTTGNVLQIRVKDFGAVFMAAILKIPYKLADTHAARDAWIAATIRKF